MQLARAKARDDAFCGTLPWLLRKHAGATQESQLLTRTARLPDEASVGVELAMQAGSYLLRLRDSRRAEREADMVALCLARDAGHSVEEVLGGAEAFFNICIRLEGGVGTAGVLSTHPPAAERLAALRKLAASLAAQQRVQRLQQQQQQQQQQRLQQRWRWW